MVDSLLSLPQQGIDFGTKAETLERLASFVRAAHILPQQRFTVNDWRMGRTAVMDTLLSQVWSAAPLIVRSSARAEDAMSASNAGHYRSILNVEGRAALEEAIQAVVSSFGGDPGQEDQVFVQPMVRDVAICGVAFTRDPNTNANYLVISYDDSSGDTSTVTSGSTNRLRTVYAYKGRTDLLEGPMARVAALCAELESLLHCDHLDVEFALDQQGDLYLLQVRPLVLPADAGPQRDAVHATLVKIEEKLERWFQPHPFLHGDRTVMGIMPDWNPAEIIGVRPRPLSLSLYKELITDGIWAYQRHNYGYRNLRSFPLIQDLGGLPYIDVRVSFNSFVPATTPPDLAGRLVNYYVDRLIAQPAFHDKVEFEIIFSCYTVDLPGRLSALRSHGFSDSDCDQLAEDLRHLTNGIINERTGLWKADHARLHTLEQRRADLLQSDLGMVSKLYWLLEDCKRYGTLPFAGLARAGFIAVQFLRSLVGIGVLSQEDHDRFMASLHAVSSQMSRDFSELSREAFLRRYGHLRPGTYDILSPRYDEDPDRYFNWNDPTPPLPPHESPFALTLDQLRRIELLLKDHRLDHDILGLFDFIKGAIEGREYSKFIFTRSVSDVLSMLTRYGREMGFTPDDMSYLDITVIPRLYASCDDPRSVFADSIAKGRAKHDITRRLVLPPLLTRPDQVWRFEAPETQPNFVTQKRARGLVVFSSSPLETLKDSILLIPSADPGFDWVFSHGIAGFVTMYGGVNSHMAIRAGELGIPAVIGVGEMEFNRLASRTSLEIDASNKQIRCLK